MLTTLLPTDIDHIANSESDFSRSVPLASFLSRERHSHLVNLQVPQTAPPAQKRHDRSRFDSANPIADIFSPDAVVRRTVISDAITAEIVQATSDRRREFRFRAPLHLLVVYEQGARRDGETFVEGLPRSTLRDFARKLVFVPAGHEYREWQEPTTAAQLMHLYFDPAKMRSFFDADTADISFAAKLFFEDATILATALKLKRALECSTSGNRLYLEALGVVLAHELIRLNRGTPRSEPPLRGGLAPWQQRIVTGYIDENLGETIPLATLARLARLSPYYFCRAFKQSFGVPPHRYHTRRRIEHAKGLLAKRAHSVTDIGLTVGYSETSSFTAAFRKATGLTPSAFQRGLS